MTKGSYNPPRGPGKGPGKGNARAAPFNSETGRDAGKNSGHVRRMMRQWREENPPDPEDMPEPLSTPEVEALAKTRSAIAIDVLTEVALNPRMMPMARVNAADKLLERAHGKAKQAVDVALKTDPSTYTDEELVAVIASGGSTPIAE